MNICIIGGSGFIGSYLINLLKQNHHLLNIDKVPAASQENMSYALCDITNIVTLRSVIPDTTDFIVLLAAEHKDDVFPTSKYYDVNVEGTKNVLSVMEEKKIKKIIFTSSVSVYGLNKENPNEDSPTDPFNHYGKSKLQAENCLRSWYESNRDERQLIILRPTVVFGPGNRGNVYNLLTQISSGRFMMIGNGNNTKSMAYVENVAGFIAHCINADLKSYHIFNYIDKPDLSTKQLVSIAQKAIGKTIFPTKIPYWFGYSFASFFDVVFKVIGKKNPISAIRIKKFCATTQFESVKTEALQFSAPFSLEKGLDITIKSIVEENKVRVKTCPDLQNGTVRAMRLIFSPTFKKAER